MNTSKNAKTLDITGFIRLFSKKHSPLNPKGFSPCKVRVVFFKNATLKNLHPFPLAFRNSAGASLSPSRPYSKRGTSEVSLLYPLYLPNRQFSRSENCSYPKSDTQSGASPSWLSPIHPSLYLPPQNKEI